MTKEISALSLIEVPEVSEQGKIVPLPKARELGTINGPDLDDTSELLEHRFLCRGGGLLIVGPTGVGKSSFVMQCALLWAIGEPAFGINPTFPLRSLIVQAENDDGDLAEMRDGVLNGLKLSKSDRDYACQNVLAATENARTSFQFFQDVVRPLLEEHRPDLLIIDPALAYLGGDTNSQKDVGAFLRNYLNPLLTEFDCGCVVVHHTSKPPQGKEKSKWKAGDLAYLGSGSAEWSNWARAVLGIRNVGSHDVFELQASKRGGRLHWEDEAGGKLYSKLIAHDREPGVICWREADASDLANAAEKTQSNERIVLSLIPETGTVSKNLLLARTGDHGVGVNKARPIIQDLITRRLVFEHPKKRTGNRPEIHLSRSPETPQFDDPVLTVVTTNQN